MAASSAFATVGLEAAIKWPNDVLLSGRKAAGVLVEAHWSGSQLEAAVVGIGINVLRGSVPPAATIRFPATSLEQALGHSPNRLEVLHAAIQALILWRPKLSSEEFLRAWEGLLAFRGDPITLTREGQSPLTGQLLGLDDDGSLKILGSQGVQSVLMGEISLQPGDDRIG